MMTVTGSSEDPEAMGPKPATTCRCTTSRKNNAPKPPYTKKVTAFVALN